jgi:hypothetical protein
MKALPVVGGKSRAPPYRAQFLRDRHDAIVPVIMTLLPMFYSGAIRNNWPRSHCCRKMVGIAGQGDLIA